MILIQKQPTGLAQSAKPVGLTRVPEVKSVINVTLALSADLGQARGTAENHPESQC